MINDKILEKQVIKEYSDIVLRVMKNMFPLASDDIIMEGINHSINKRFKNSTISINNNYTNKKINTTILDICEYILDKKPIMTAYGVLYQQHGTVKNPFYKLIDALIKERKVTKKEMFKYPKGSFTYEKLNLIQSLLKIDANGIYGALGQKTCLIFNLYTAGTTTMQARSCECASGLLFESFLANNVPFGSYDEIIMFIHNVCKEDRKYDDKFILDEDISVEEVLFHIGSNVGFGFIPTEEEFDLLYSLLQSLPQNDINRLFYKNNLFYFTDNTYVKNMIIDMVQKLDEPYLDPNEVPHSIINEIEDFWQLLKEYVYYDQQIIDKFDKMESLIRSNTVIMDTDSTIVSLDGWYQYVLDMVKDIPREKMPIKHHTVDVIKAIKFDEFGDRIDMINPISYIDEDRDYDFANDEIIEFERMIDPLKIIPQDNLKYSIVNILAYCMYKMILDYMQKYVFNANATNNPDGCILIMKNEIYILKLLVSGKRNYAYYQLLQEGKITPENARLNIKGMPAFIKSTVNETTRNKLKEVLLEEILTSTEVDQVELLKKLAIIEKDMYTAMMNGSKEYFKPVRIKSMNSYSDPMRIQGIKASVCYNYIKEPHNTPINLNDRSSINIIKCNITSKNYIKIANEYPEVCANIKRLLDSNEIKGNIIDSIAIPITEDTPKWIIPFIDYKTIISDNVSLFPLERLGIYRGNNVNMHSNILKI